METYAERFDREGSLNEVESDLRTMGLCEAQISAFLNDPDIDSQELYFMNTDLSLQEARRGRELVRESGFAEPRLSF